MAQFSFDNGRTWQEIPVESINMGECHDASPKQEALWSDLSRVVNTEIDIQIEFREPEGSSGFFEAFEKDIKRYRRWYYKNHLRVPFRVGYPIVPRGVAF